MIKITLYITSLIFTGVLTWAHGSDEGSPSGGSHPSARVAPLPISPIGVRGAGEEGPQTGAGVAARSLAAMSPPVDIAAGDVATTGRQQTTESVGVSVPLGVNPMLQGGLSQALRSQAFVPNTLADPSPFVYNSRRCMLATTQTAECGLRPLAYAGAAASTVLFVLAATVEPIPLLQSPYFVYGVWASAITGGVALIKQGTPNLVRDLQEWVKQVDDQRAAQREALTGAAAPRLALAHDAAGDAV